MKNRSSFIFTIVIFILFLTCQQLFTLSEWIEFSAAWHYVPALPVIEENELPPDYNILEEDPAEKLIVVEIKGKLYVVNLE